MTGDNSPFAADGPSSCGTQTVLFPPKKGLRGAGRLFRAATLLYAPLHDDARILGLRFSPGYAGNDAVLEAFAGTVDGMEAW